MLELLDSDESVEMANSIARYSVAAMEGWLVGDVAELTGVLAREYNGVIATLESWDSRTEVWKCRLHDRGDELIPFKPVNLKKPSPSPWVGAHRHNDATCRLWTMGWYTEGIAYNRDDIVNKLKGDGHNIPRSRMFDCTPLKNKSDCEYFDGCTGSNMFMFRSAWEHRKTVDIAWRFADEYSRWEKTRAPGDEFHAVFYCREGNHESVAIAQGLRSWLRQKENVDVILCRTSEKEHRRLFCDPCMWCRMPRDRTEWEVKLVLDALHGRRSWYI